MKKLFSVLSLIIAGITAIIMFFSFYLEYDNKELTLFKDSHDIYLSDEYDFFDYNDSLEYDEFLTIMPSKISINVDSIKSRNISISKWIIENSGSSVIQNDSLSPPIKIQLPKENKIYLAWLEGSYIDEDKRELEIDTTLNTVLIREFLLNNNDQLWITIVNEFTSAKKNNLNPIFSYKDEGITGFKYAEDWDPLNINNYVNLYVGFYGFQIYVFFIVGIVIFSIGSFKIIVFKLSNKRKLIELIINFYLSISLASIITSLIFNLPIGIEISFLISVLIIVYYIRLYLFIKSH
ncbi:hypothetical protein ACPUEN_06990 [Algoriphagus yeomjeoni]|uniref:hypothetical protein n=1 Tax=Algoriphagus yeomjeoni TaxID=291403 RepID=UPI003CE5411B